MAQIDQKEYLKRYLSSDEQLGIKKKKKKKVAKSVGDRVKIIDDDIFTTHSQTITAEELLALNEEAPQIVGYVDERPLEMRIDDYRESGLWKPVSPTSNENVVQDNLKLQFAMKNENTSKKSQKGLLAIKDKKERNRAESPPRRVKCEESSPTSNRSRVEKSNDWSPPRRKRRDEDSSPQRKSCVGDSPQRRFSSTDRDYSPPRKSRDDLSPRRVKDFSPRRRNRKGEDSSRKRNNDSLDRKQSGNDRDYCPLSKSRNDDLSTNRDKDFSPARRKRNIDSLENDKNYSPARKVNSDELSLKKQRNKDFSPKRYKYSHESDNRPTEIVRHSRKSENKTLDNFSKSSYKIVDKKKSSRWDSSPPRKYSDSPRDGSPVALKKLSKTLDGKTAGLQNAVELAKETAEYRRREDSLFRNMSENISGANASTVVRDKKTGKIRDLEKEAEDQKQKQQIEDKNAEKYSKWGKGLKQVEDRNAKLADDIHEMNKPLARYADDEDLEKFLKEQEREGDPMLAYIRKKKKKAAVEAGKPEKPQYEGEFMPNRFGIRPGYRWDGVDRSNGYEKKWFEKQNAKTAVEEEVYKWNVSDM